jgi:hypothetical protein
VENSNATTNASQYNYLKDKKLWLAWYTNDHTNTGLQYVKIPKPWTKINLWQYGTPAIGKSYGVNSLEIDMNERLDDFLPGPIEPTPTEPEENTMWSYEYINTAGNMSIRPAPNTNNTAIGQLNINTKAYGNQLYDYSNGDRWVKIEQGGSAVGWVAVIHLGKAYGKLDIMDNTTPPPPEPSTDTFTATIRDDVTGETWSGILTRQ